MKTKVLEHIEVLVKRYPALEVVKNEIIAAYQIIEKSYKNSGKLLVAGNGCNLVRRTEKGRLRRRGWGLRWEKAQKGGKGTNLRGFFED